MDTTQRSQPTTPAEGIAHGYIKARDKELLQNRLRRIEGQVRGVQRMVDEEAYCIDGSLLVQENGLDYASGGASLWANFKD